MSESFDELPLPAREVPETARALAVASRFIILCGGASALLVLVLNYVLHKLFSGGGVLAGLDLVFISLAFLSFLYFSLRYLALMHTRHVLRRNPWVEWYANGGEIVLFNRVLARVLVLAHPDWPEEVIVTAHPTYQAVGLLSEPKGPVWAAGNPAKTVILSSPGGSMIVRGKRWKPAILRKRLRRMALGLDAQ